LAHLVHELDPNGRQLRVVKYTDYAAESVRSIARTSAELRGSWADAEKRSKIIASLKERGIDFEELAEQTGQMDADPFDLLCYLAFNAPLRTRRERAQKLKSERKDYFDKFSPEARQILDELLEKYAEHGPRATSCARTRG
jgi:type I restriction enzyme R subunit